MSVKKTYTCERCGDPADPKRSTSFGGKWWHFECPNQAFDRIMSELEEESK
jgi:hypothetical protein